MRVKSILKSLTCLSLTLLYSVYFIAGVSMGVVNKKGVSRTKTFRFDEAIIEELTKEAEKGGVSTNQLTEKIIEHYLEHERWNKDLSSLTILPNTIKALINVLDEETLTEIGSELGASFPKEYLLMRGMSTDKKATQYFILKTLSENNHWFNASYHTGGTPYYYIRIELGMKWSLFLEAYLRAFFENLLEEKIVIRRAGENFQILLEY